MGVPLMLKKADAERIERLKQRLGARSKVAVVRTALDMLERDAERADRVRRWERAVRLATGESRRVAKDFRPHGRLGDTLSSV